MPGKDLAGIRYSRETFYGLQPQRFEALVRWAEWGGLVSSAAYDPRQGPAGGKSGGFSARGGAATKLKLLRIEGAEAAGPPTLFD